MNTPYSQNNLHESHYVPDLFRSPKSSNSPSVNSYLQYNPTCKRQEMSHKNHLRISPQPNFRKGFQPRINHNKKSRKTQNAMMSNLKSSLMGIKQDVSRLIQENDLLERQQCQKGKCVQQDDGEYNPELKKKRSTKCSDDYIKRSFFHQLGRKSSHLEGIKKHSCLSQRNSSSEHRTIQQIEHELMRQNEQQSSHQNLFSTPKLSPINVVHQHSTYSSQISRNSNNTYSSSPFEKLLAENIANKQAIKCLEKMVYENQESRRELEFQINFLNNNSHKYSTTELLKIENYRLSELLNQQRYVRCSLEKKLQLNAMEMQNLGRSQYFSQGERNVHCNCQLSKNYDKQIRMVEQSYRTQIYSLETQIKLVKTMLENYEQRSKQPVRKSAFAQTQDDWESQISTEISKKDMKQELEMIRNDAIKLIVQKQSLEHLISKLEIQNQQLKRRLEKIVDQSSEIQDANHWIEQINRQQQKYNLQLSEVDACCLQLQEENTRLKSMESGINIFILSNENKIKRLQQELSNKNIKIQYLQQKLMSTTSQQMAEFSIEKINLILQIKEIENNFNAQTQGLKKELEIAIVSCENLAGKIRVLCEQAQRKDEFISSWIKQNSDVFSASKNQDRKQKYYKQIQNYYKIDRTISQAKEIEQLKQLNRKLASFIDENSLNRINLQC